MDVDVELMSVVGSASVQCPPESAVVDAVSAVPPVGPSASAATVAPGAVVPLTVMVLPLTIAPLAGEVTVTASAPGMPCRT
jgi:hypothetical protein